MFLPHALVATIGFRILLRCIIGKQTFQVCFFAYWVSGGLLLKALEEKILKEGTVLPGSILKVGSFLNHQIDPAFIIEMGKEISRIYAGNEVTKILTIEASGIAIAVGAGIVMNLPVVFAKKHNSSNVDGELYCSVVHSYTHGRDYNVVVSKEFIKPGDKVLIVDDFLANGKALLGLIDIVKQAKAEVVGCTCAIEKGFQRGGDNLRKEGVRVESLAVIESMENNMITFRKQGV